MKVTVQCRALLPSLRIAAAPCQSNSPEMAVSHLLLEAETKKGLVLTGSDRESVVSTHGVEAGISGKGAVAVPARPFLDLCSRFEAEAEVQMELMANNSLKLMSRKGTYRLPGVKPDGSHAQGTPLQEPEDGYLASIEVPSDRLARLLERVGPFMAGSDWRSYLLGSLLEVGEGELRAVATDGHRMAFHTLELAKGKKGGEDLQALIPRRAVALIHQTLRALGGDPEEEGEEAAKAKKKNAPMAKVEIAADRVRISTPTTSFATLLINSKYPDYQRVLPTGDFRTMSVDRPSLRGALERARVVAESDSSVTMRLEGNSLEVSTRARPGAEADDETAAKEYLEVKYDGPDHEVSFNAQYILDVLHILESDLVEWHLRKPADAAELREPGSASPRYIVMPLRN